MLGVSSVLDPKVFYGRIASVLPSSIGVDLVFRGVVDYRKIKPATFLRGLVRI